MENKQGNILFFGLILYIAIFYSQIGGRVPPLGAIRIELIVGSILLVAVTFKILSEKNAFYKNRLNYFITAFFLYFLLTLPLAYGKGLALETLIHLLKYAVLYVLIIAVVNNEKRLKSFLLVYVLVSSVIFLEPFWWVLHGEGFQYNSGAMRLFGYGKWDHPNSLGGFTVSNLPFLFLFIMHEKSILKKMLFVMLFLISIYVIFMTQSRTAYVGLLAFFVFISLGMRSKIIGVTALIVILFLTWHFAPEEAKERLLTLKQADKVFTEGGSGDSMDNRWELIKISFEAFKESPIIGIGIGYFVPYCGFKYNMWLPTHNLYAQLIAETGIVGTILFLIIIIQIIKNLKAAKSNYARQKIEDTFTNRASSVVLYFLLVRLVLGLFGDDLIENYWWFAGGLSVVLLKFSAVKMDKKVQNAAIKT